MENEERDWFTQGWGDDGVVSDSREEEALPEETPEGGEAALPEGEAAPGEAAPSGEGWEKEAGAAMTAGPASAGGESREADFIRFINEYPQVEAGDIPPEVWQRVKSGESLVTAYARYEARTLREENRRLRQTQENRFRSAGSQRGTGSAAPRRDAFEEGWEVE